MMKRERLLLFFALLLALFAGTGCRSGQAEEPASPAMEEQVASLRPETAEEEKKTQSDSPEPAPEADAEKPEESAPSAHEGIWTPSELENSLATGRCSPAPTSS